MARIDRVRYYDGEFLRAFDLSDEQTYHLEMRRRLNRYLHRCGIVQGLTLSSDTQAGVTQVSIMPGMAIDDFGREIYLFVPYSFGNQDVTNSRITRTGTYDVWLRYQRSPSTPPSVGYSNCNQINQYTRWDESFSVVLLPSPSSPFTIPAFADVDTDDPTQDSVGVLLGTVLIDPTSPTATFASPLFDPARCVLLGIVAQSIQIPPAWDAAHATPPLSFLNKSGSPNTSLSPPASLDIQPNIFAGQNLVVGKDFVLTSSGGTTVTIQPSPTVKDPGAGSVKVAGDLFVQGNIYSLFTSTTPPPTPPPPIPPPAGTDLWLDISGRVKAVVQQSMPDFVASNPVQVVVPAAAPAANSFQVTAPAIVIPSKLGAMSSVVASAAISGVQLNTPVSFAASVGILINNVSAAPGIGQCTVSVTYTVTGDFVVGGKPSILSFNVCATAICFPVP